MTRTAACVIVKNEARDFAEWIAYYSLLGFDALIVFDNQSTDQTEEIAREAAKEFPIHVWPWIRSDEKTQTDAYEAACQRFGSDFDWIGFFDADEFLTLHQHQNVRDFLARFDNFAGVAINWAVFGANGHEDFHKDLVIESFIRRSTEDFFVNRHVKSFVRPNTVKDCPNPHFFSLAGPYCDPQLQPMDWMHKINGHDLVGGVSDRMPDFSVCQLNHYFTRSRAHWAEKVRRGYPADIEVRKTEQFEIYNRNDIEDRSAAALAPAVHTQMAKLFKSRFS